MRALVIADDFSGAAEIAGIGVRYGLSARLERSPAARPEGGLTVLDTDSRTLLPDNAARTVAEFVRILRSRPFDLIYKKTDSVLRGPVLAELDALMSAFHRTAALLVPQNPSRGRTIRAGQYEIDGVPLNQTPFANDPQYPARSSNPIQLLGRSSTHTVKCLEPVHVPAQTGITVGAGTTAAHVQHWASRTAGWLLPAGGADFFAAILQRRGLRERQAHLIGLRPGPTLVVCGSASGYSGELSDRAQREGMPVCPMPDDLAAWPAVVLQALQTQKRALVTIGRPIDPSPGAAERFGRLLTEAVAKVLATERVDNLLMSGGATASAICRRMGWYAFHVAGELAPGVVQMRVDGSAAPSLVVKPGSYSWPESVWTTAPKG